MTDKKVKPLKINFICGKNNYNQQVTFAVGINDVLLLALKFESCCFLAIWLFYDGVVAVAPLSCMGQKWLFYLH